MSRSFPGRRWKEVFLARGMFRRDVWSDKWFTERREIIGVEEGAGKAGWSHSSKTS